MNSSHARPALGRSRSRGAHASTARTEDTVTATTSHGNARPNPCHTGEGPARSTSASWATVSAATATAGSARRRGDERDKQGHHQNEHTQSDQAHRQPAFAAGLRRPRPGRNRIGHRRVTECEINCWSHERTLYRNPVYRLAVHRWPSHPRAVVRSRETHCGSTYALNRPPGLARHRWRQPEVQLRERDHRREHGHERRA